MKFFEIRDSATFIPCFAFSPVEEARLPNSHRAEYDFLVGRAGYLSKGIIVFGNLNSCKAQCDAYGWGDRTMQTAHLHIEKNWDKLEGGEVIDVQFILGESTFEKRSERCT